MNTYDRAIAALKDLTMILTPDILSVKEAQQAIAELPSLSAAEVMEMLAEYRDESKVLFPEYRPILAKHGFK